MKHSYLTKPPSDIAKLGVLNKKSVYMAIAVIGVTLYSSSSYAQAVPLSPLGAGAINSQLRQQGTVVQPVSKDPNISIPAQTQTASVASPTKGSTVTLRAIQFKGLEGTGVKESALQQFLMPSLSKPQSFDGLQKIASDAASFLRLNGLVVAQVALPPQSLNDGVLILQVVPGTYDKAKISNTSRADNSLVNRIVNSNMPEGKLVSRESLERTALLLNEIPGVSAAVSLTRGQNTGTTSADLSVEPSQRFGGYIGGDNQGDPNLGTARLLTGAWANNLIGQGDILRVDLMGVRSGGVVNGTVDYSALVGGQGTRIGASYSHLNYHYDLDTLGYKGTSDSWNVYAQNPIVRSARTRIDLRLDAGQQYLNDTYPGDLGSGKKSVNSSTLSVNGSTSTLGGLTNFNASLTAGSVNYRNDISRELAFADEAGTKGGFTRINYRLNHEYSVTAPISLWGSISGQYAGKNLDSSQKFLLGGPNAVRAYAAGSGAVDNGTVLTAEVRYHKALPFSGLKTTPELTVAAFYDQGFGSQFNSNKDKVNGGPLLGAGNHLNFAGAGLYATVAEAGNYAVTATWARRTAEVSPSARNNDKNRFWLSLIKTF